MEKQYLLDLAGQPTALAEALKDNGVLFDPAGWAMYEPENHDVFNPEKRQKKTVKAPTGSKDANGEPIYQDKQVEVVRVAVPAQKLIVARAAAFAAGAPVTLVANPETPEEKRLFKMIKKVWDDNKLDFRNLPIAETMMAQREVAEIWHFEDVPAGYWKDLAPRGVKRMRMNVIKPSEGNDLYPVFNRMRDLVGFGRAYKVNVDGEDVMWLDLYTDEKVYLFEEKDGNWQPRTAEGNEAENLLEKIPVVYFSQGRFEWQDVDSIIARLEELLSNHGDINDYNGSPALVATGKIIGFSAKGERGKAYQMEKGAELRYLSWDHAPESIKLEIENCFNSLYTFTQTPNISFEAVKGIGAQSGVSIKLLFMDAHSKARRKHLGSYGESIQRRINLIKAGCIKIDATLQSAENLTVMPEFTDYMPTNEVEEATVESTRVNTLMRANGEQPIISRETALLVSPLPVEDTTEELTKLNEADKQNALTGGL